MAAAKPGTTATSFGVKNLRNGAIMGLPPVVLPEAQSGTCSSRNAPYRRIVFVLGVTLGLLMVLVGWRIQNFVRNVDDPYGFVDMGRRLCRGQGFAHAG